MVNFGPPSFRGANRGRSMMLQTDNILNGQSSQQQGFALPPSQPISTVPLPATQTIQPPVQGPVVPPGLSAQVNPTGFLSNPAFNFFAGLAQAIDPEGFGGRIGGQVQGMVQDQMFQEFQQALQNNPGAAAPVGLNQQSMMNAASIANQNRQTGIAQQQADLQQTQVTNQQNQFDQRLAQEQSQFSQTFDQNRLEFEETLGLSREQLAAEVAENEATAQHRSNVLGFEAAKLASQTYQSEQDRAFQIDSAKLDRELRREIASTQNEIAQQKLELERDRDSYGFEMGEREFEQRQMEIEARIGFMTAELTNKLVEQQQNLLVMQSVANRNNAQANALNNPFGQFGGFGGGQPASGVSGSFETSDGTLYEPIP